MNLEYWDMTSLSFSDRVLLRLEDSLFRVPIVSMTPSQSSGRASVLWSTARVLLSGLPRSSDASCALDEYYYWFNSIFNWSDVCLYTSFLQLLSEFHIDKISSSRASTSFSNLETLTISIATFSFQFRRMCTFLFPSTPRPSWRLIVLDHGWSWSILLTQWLNSIPYDSN